MLLGRYVAFKKAIDEAMAMQADFEAKATEKERRWLLVERRARQGGSDTTTTTTSNSHLDLVKKGELIESHSENLKTFFKDSAMLETRFQSYHMGHISYIYYRPYDMGPISRWANLNLKGLKSFFSPNSQEWEQSRLTFN